MYQSPNTQYIPKNTIDSTFEKRVTILENENHKSSSKKIVMFEKMKKCKEDGGLNLSSTPFYNNKICSNPWAKPDTPKKASTTSEKTNDSARTKFKTSASFSPHDYIKSFEELFIEVLIQ